MRHVTLTTFGGIVPRVAEHNLDVNQATIAHNVRLRNGRIEAWRERCPFAAYEEGMRSFHIYNQQVLSFPEQVQVAEVSPDYGRLFITGRSLQAEVLTVRCDGKLSSTLLGVPAPTTAPSVGGTGACSRASDARSYVYTYVNQWGEESAPSPASAEITIADGSAVSITGLVSPPSGYGIEAINIYRAVTGLRDISVKEQHPETEFLLVDSIPATSHNYMDTIALVDLGYSLETARTQTPPKGLRNICSLPDAIRLAGCTTNRVYLSEPFQLNNWPVKYELTLDHNIVHMGVLHDQLYVTTDSIPYLIKVADCANDQCNTVTRFDTELPDISCGYTRGALMTKHGYIYASNVGLILLRPNATYTVLTTKWFSPEQWAEVAPETVRLGYYQGFLFCVTNRVSFCINIDGDIYGDMRGTELSTLSDFPVDMFTSSTGELFMFEDGAVTVWDHGTTFRPYCWESRPLTGQDPADGTISLTQTHVSPRGSAWSPASAKIKTGGLVHFTLKTPEVVTYARDVYAEEPFRLPRIGRHLWYKVRLEGTSTVEFITFGTANFTLNQGK